ncbi:helix-turn-helix domain-containing protein [Amycolatopsis sp. CA-126428]|uniref:helix-turn-helix domain-containing protein n=1 Tax=Amycolatopsis sp. CA-126428 TaxID=2073158 RepID=UPI000CD1BDA5|nr:helix-turn-helix transcriptional regulator [Amycolatopsis sp. CA-126428]
MVSIDNVRYRRVLGDELRQARAERGWTREELRSRMGGGLSLQTLATYEQGTRQCTLIRFVELCVALGESPSDLLARAHRRMAAGPETGLRLDLTRIVHSAPPALEPLRRWAQNRLALSASPDDAKEVIPPAAIEQLARLCGMSVAGVVTALGQLAPSPC